MNAKHCDADGCDTWQRAPSRVPIEWWTLHDRLCNFYDFCSLDHVMRWAAANSQPATEIPA